MINNKIKERITWVKSTDALAGLALFFASLFFFYDLLGGRYLFTERDLGPYFIPPRSFWVESIKDGHFPLWNPYLFSGYPFFANPQHAILYPLNGLFFLLPFDLAFNAIIILHFFLGGLFTYLLLKDLKANATGALISGLIFMLGGYLLSVHSLLTILLSVIWTPLIMMFFRRAIASPELKNEILTGVFMTISFLGGGVEIVYGNFFVLFFMVVLSTPDWVDPEVTPKSPFAGSESRFSGFFRKLPISRRRPRGFYMRFRSFLVVSLAFFLLSAVQLIPFLELFHYSIRGGGISYHEATIWSFAPKDVLLFFLPDAYGYFLDMKKYWVNQCWFKTLYTGGLPFILSLIFFLPLCRSLSPSSEKNGVKGSGSEKKLYFSLMFFSLFLSLGQYNPLYPYLFKYFPFFNGIRYPVKFLYIFILVLSVTAGLGCQRLMVFSKEDGRKGLRNLFIVFALASGLLLLAFILGHKEIEHFLGMRKIDFPDFNRLPVNLYHVKRFLFYLTVFFLLIRIGDEVKWKGWAKVLLIVFLTTDLFGNMGFYGKEKTSDYFEKTKIQEWISSDQGCFRTFSTGKTISMDTPILIPNPLPLEIVKEKHIPSLNMLHRLHDIWGIDVIRLKRTDDLYRAFVGTPSISTTHLLDLYGVKYVVSVTPIEKDPRFELIYSRIEGLNGKKEDLLKENTIKLYRIRDSFPRGWLVKDFKVLDSRTILLRMIAKEFHPDREVLLEEKPSGLPTSPMATGGKRKSPHGGMRRLGDKVIFMSENINRLRLRVEAEENAFLVLSDTYYPGWKVFVYPVRYDSYHRANVVDTNSSNRVDGKKTKIYRADYNFRAVPLEAGEYEVEFVYDPVSFKVGSLISLLTLIGMVVYFVKKKQRVS